MQYALDAMLGGVGGVGAEHPGVAQQHQVIGGGGQAGRPQAVGQRQQHVPPLMAQRRRDRLQRQQLVENRGVGDARGFRHRLARGLGLAELAQAREQALVLAPEELFLDVVTKVVGVHRSFGEKLRRAPRAVSGATMIPALRGALHDPRNVTKASPMKRGGKLPPG